MAPPEEQQFTLIFRTVPFALKWENNIGVFHKQYLPIRLRSNVNLFTITDIYCPNANDSVQNTTNIRGGVLGVYDRQWNIGSKKDKFIWIYFSH